MLARIFVSVMVVVLGCGAANATTKPSIKLTEGHSPVIVPEDYLKAEAGYAGQQAKLQGVLGDTAFVASYQGIVHDGRVVTFSIWTDSVPTALPKTDFVWLQDAKMTQWFVVPWSDLEAAIGKLPPLERVDPPRYLTPANIPASYFSSLQKTFAPPQGFPERLASGHR